MFLYANWVLALVDDLELFHAWDSVQSFKVRMCLAELALPWQSRPLRLTQLEHVKPEYLAINPAGLVPCLRHQGGVITESSIINEYLCDIVGRCHLRPVQAGARAAMRMWCHYEDTVAHMSVRPATFNFHVKPLVSRMATSEFEALIAHHPNAERAAAYRQAVSAPFDEAAVIGGICAMAGVVQKMEQALDEAPWLAGPDFSLADVALGAFLERLLALSLDRLLDDAPNVDRWARTIRQRPSYVRAQGKSDAAVSTPSAEVSEWVRKAVSRLNSNDAQLS